MLPNLGEIVLILLIVAIVFGVGKLGKLGQTVGKLKSNFQKGLEEGEQEDAPIDITPSHEDVEEKFSGPKPGTAQQPVEEAELVD